VRRPISCAIAKSGGTPKASQPSPVVGTLFSVVLLLTPHSADAAQHTGSFVEPNILVGAASACQTLHDPSWRKAGARHGDNISALPEPNKHELRGQRQLLMARRRLPRSLRLCRRLEVKRTRCARRAVPGVPNRTLRAPGRELWYPPPNAMGRFNEAADPQMALAARAERPRVLARLHDSTKWPGVPTS
jgi:hypothetical protein